MSKNVQCYSRVKKLRQLVFLYYNLLSYKDKNGREEMSVTLKENAGNSVVWVYYNKAQIIKYLYIKRYVENR